jgi:methylphosphotriester-DNA--protein-cysteine methyltransferase
VKRLKSQLLEAKSDFQIIAAIEKFVSTLLLQKRMDKRLFTAMDLIYNQHVYNVNSLCKQTELSTTGLRNLCKDRLGNSPKNLAKIIRINRVLKSYNPYNPINQMDLAYLGGYFDQAHFIKDFKGIMGCTPKKYFNNPNLTFDFYNSGRWQAHSFVN